MSAADKASDKAKNAQKSFIQRLQDDGVLNPQGLSMASFGALFVAAVPLTSFVAQPNGLLERAVNGLCHGVTWVGTAGATNAVGQTGKIAALSALYITVTFALSGAGSAAGVASGNKEGRDNNHPRSQVHNLKGLPLRLHSAHYNLMEMFPGFALSAALAQAVSPGNQTLINLLGLHVISKVFIYYPSYLLNLGAPRSLAHVLATASVMNVAFRIAGGVGL